MPCWFYIMCALGWGFGAGWLLAEKLYNRQR
jgi:hypothetical protein